jgi:hypothetical protein
MIRSVEVAVGVPAGLLAALLLSWQGLLVHVVPKCCASFSLGVGICVVIALVFLARRRHAVLPDDYAAQWPRATVPDEGGGRRPTYHWKRQ